MSVIIVNNIGRDIAIIFASKLPFMMNVFNFHGRHAVDDDDDRETICQDFMAPLQLFISK